MLIRPILIKTELEENDWKMKKSPRPSLLSTVSLSPCPEIRDTGNRIEILGRGDEEDNTMVRRSCQHLVLELNKKLGLISGQFFFWLWLFVCLIALLFICLLNHLLDCLDAYLFTYLLICLLAYLPSCLFLACLFEPKKFWDLNFLDPKLFRNQNFLAYIFGPISF